MKSSIWIQQAFNIQGFNIWGAICLFNIAFLPAYAVNTNSSHGNGTLHLLPPLPAFRVSTQTLGLVSPVLARIFSNSSNHYLDKDDDPEAVRIVVSIFHFKDTGIPIDDIDPELLSNIAKLCEKWQCVQALGPWPKLWLSVWDKRGEKGCQLWKCWLNVGKVFGREDIVDCVMRETAPSLWREYALNGINELKGSFSGEFIAKMSEARIDAIARMEKTAKEFLRSLFELPSLCQNLPDSSKECDALALGSSMRMLSQFILDSNPQASRDVSIDFLLKKLDGTTFDILTMGNHTVCKDAAIGFKTKLLASFDQYISGLDEEIAQYFGECSNGMHENLQPSLTDLPSPNKEQISEKPNQMSSTETGKTFPQENCGETTTTIRRNPAFFNFDSTMLPSKTLPEEFIKHTGFNNISTDRKENATIGPIMAENISLGAKIFKKAAKPLPLQTVKLTHGNCQATSNTSRMNSPETASTEQLKLAASDLGKKTEIEKQSPTQCTTETASLSSDLRTRNEPGPNLRLNPLADPFDFKPLKQASVSDGPIGSVKVTIKEPEEEHKKIEEHNEQVLTSLFPNITPHALKSALTVANGDLKAAQKKLAEFFRCQETLLSQEASEHGEGGGNISNYRRFDPETGETIHIAKRDGSNYMESDELKENNHQLGNSQGACELATITVSRKDFSASTVNTRTVSRASGNSDNTTKSWSIDQREKMMQDLRDPVKKSVFRELRTKYRVLDCALVLDIIHRNDYNLGASEAEIKTHLPDNPLV